MALLALVAVVWLNVSPHRHSDDWSERHCPACQILRSGDGENLQARAVDLAPPPVRTEGRLAELEPATPQASRHGGPAPGRSPPLALS